MKNIYKRNIKLLEFLLFGYPFQSTYYILNEYSDSVKKLK